MAEFYFHLETEPLRLEDELRTDTYVPRAYRTFLVREPKPRRICAADIRDRVVHHADTLRLRRNFFRAAQGVEG